MCPPASIPPATELGEYVTDEVIFKSLMQLKSGCSLPSNVLADVNPYQFTPSNLPADMWYFLNVTKMDAENGFWRSTGEACEIYSTSAIIGLRKTLRFYESQAPDGQKTNWMMQEYTTTEKCSSKPDFRALYRVFLVDDSISGRVSKSDLLEKNLDDVAGPSAMANQSPEPPSVMSNQSPEPPSAMANQSPDLSVGDYVSRGDYLELDDLAIPLSRTTSSTDSSCMTMSMTSEEFFDSVALLLELEDDDTDTVDQENQDSRIKLNLSSPAKLKEVVVHPTTLESIDSGKESKPSMGQTSKTDPTAQNESENCRNKSTSNGVNTTASSSSSSSEGSSKEEKKDRANRTKKRKMMKYLCFLAF